VGVGQRNGAYNGSTHWRHLTNTIERLYDESVFCFRRVSWGQSTPCFRMLN